MGIISLSQSTVCPLGIPSSHCTAIREAGHTWMSLKLVTILLSSWCHSLPLSSCFKERQLNRVRYSSWLFNFLSMGAQMSFQKTPFLEQEDLPMHLVSQPHSCKTSVNNSPSPHSRLRLSVGTVGAEPRQGQPYPTEPMTKPMVSTTSKQGPQPAAAWGPASTWWRWCAKIISHLTGSAIWHGCTHGRLNM